MPRPVVEPDESRGNAYPGPEPSRLLLLTTTDLSRSLPQRTNHLIRFMPAHVGMTVIDVRAARRRNDWWYKLSRSAVADTISREAPRGITIEAAFSAFSRLAPLTDMQLIRFFRRAARTVGQRWDVCLAQGPLCGAAAATLKRSGLFDTLVYEDLDDFPAFFPTRPVERRAVALLEGLSLRSADLVVSVGDLLAARARERGAKQTAVVTNGADWGAFSIPAQLPPPYSTIYVGSLEPWAGLEVAVQAVALLISKGHDASLRVYGKGSPAQEAQLRQVIEQARVAGAVSLEGVVAYDELPAVLGRARVGLVPFAPGRLAAHAFPLKLVEYMSAGLNVVGTRVGELGSRLAALQGGRAVDYTAAGFAEGIAEMSERLTLGRMFENRGAVADFDWPALVEREWGLIGETWRKGLDR